MNSFENNTNGILSLKNKTKDFYNMLIQGFIAYLILLSAFKYTIDSAGYFLFLAIFLTLLYIFASIIIPITLVIRINKVVRKMQFDNSQLILTTKIKFIYTKDDIVFKEVQNRFTGFSIRKKSGILLRTKDGKEFWIIEDFYNNYEELRAQLILFSLKNPGK